LVHYAFVNEDLNGKLLDLANTAWRDRKTGDEFYLDPNALGHPQTESKIAYTFGLLYTHAKIWSRGLNVPEQLPRISISSIIKENVVGQYSQDGNYANVMINRSILNNAGVLLATLAHEACHHIMDLSFLNDPACDENERKTDLAVYAFGFGRIAEMVWRRSDCSQSLGYLTKPEHDYAQKWTLYHRYLFVDGSGPVEKLESHLYKKMINIFNGDDRVAQRWYEHAKAKNPDFSVEEILEWIIEAQQRDNR
jgi:hypothetical protein